MLFEGYIHDLVKMIPWVAKRSEQRSIRAIIEQRRRIYDVQLAAVDSEAIVAQIEKLPLFHEAKTVMLYYPIHNEVDLRSLVKKYAGEKTFLLPVTHRNWIEPRRYEGEDKLRKGRHHSIPEPQTEPFEGTIDLIFVPGVVFDKQLHRIGRGGGYYDKFLRKHKRVKKIAVAYDFQIRKRTLPHLWLDQKVDQIITPTQSIG